MITQRQYWDKKIIEWSASGYKKENKNTSLIEQIAYSFRKADKRLNAGLNMIGPLAKDKTVIDLGFGIGEFCFKLLDYKPKKAIGIDIADSAVKLAKKIALTKKVSDRVTFTRRDVANLKALPKSDFIVGLGFIDYLNKDQLIKLFQLIGKRQYLFSYFEKKISLINLLHAIYIKIQNCPGAYKFTRNEMKDIIPRLTKPFIISKKGLVFLTNIPGLKQLDWEKKL